MSIQIRQVNKFQFEARIGDHVIICDLPKEKGGMGEHPDASEIFAASLGMCAATFAQFFAVQSDTEITDLQIRVLPEKQESPKKFTKVTIEIDAPMIKDDQKKRFEAFVNGCMLTNTVKDSIVIEKKFNYSS